MLLEALIMKRLGGNIWTESGEPLFRWLCGFASKKM